MIPLNKRLTRVIPLELKRGQPEPIIVTLYPGSTLGFRHPRSRKEYLLDLRSAYLLAASREADQFRANRHKDKQIASRVIRRA